MHVRYGLTLNDTSLSPLKWEKYTLLKLTDKIKNVKTEHFEHKLIQERNKKSSRVPTILTLW